jgi:hypothetical protein
MSYEPYRDWRADDGRRPTHTIGNEGNIPGTPLSAGVGLAVLAILIGLVGLGLLYLLQS